MFDNAVQIADLKLYIKILKDQVSAFESGEKYVRLQEEHRKIVADRDRTIKYLEAELEKAHAETSKVLKIWMQACDDVVAEKERELKAKNRELEKMRKLMFKAQSERDAMKDRLHEKNLELYDVKTQLEEALGKIQKLTAEVNRDYTNSGKSSSMSPNHAKIYNGREKTTRHPGGQKGHVCHPRKRKEPTLPAVQIPVPEKFLDTSKYRPTGKKACKQVQGFRIVPVVIDFETDEFICIETGKKVHAEFPEGITNDVNYDGSVKAIAYYLNNKCNVSIENTRAFLKEFSGGIIDISSGMVCKLSKQFSRKTEEERRETARELLTAPVVNVDFTFGRVDGGTAAVLVCVADDLTLYAGKEKKGHEGVKDTPVEIYQGTIISDHESTFSNYGSAHQECLVHVQRYLRSSMENDPERTWDEEMLNWTKEAIHYWNTVREEGGELDEAKVAELEKKYDDIIEKAEEEYTDEPASDYYKEGYNTYRRMAEKRDNYRLFLHNINVAPTNNAAERAGRKYKRKSKAVMCFRSMDGHKYFCDGLTVMVNMQAKGENLFEGLAKRFGNLLPEGVS